MPIIITWFGERIGDIKVTSEKVKYFRSFLKCKVALASIYRMRLSSDFDVLAEDTLLCYLLEIRDDERHQVAWHDLGLKESLGEPVAIRSSHRHRWAILWRVKERAREATVANESQTEFRFNTRLVHAWEGTTCIGRLELSCSKTLKLKLNKYQILFIN